MINPYAIIAVLVLAIALAGGGYWKGHHDASSACKADASAQLETSRRDSVTELRAANAGAAELESQNAEQKIIYRTITKQVDRIVERPEYRGDCFDDDGLRSARAAISGTLTDTTKPDGTVP